MTQATVEDFEIDPFTFLGSTLGNAHHSGLSLEDVFNALRVTETARRQNKKVDRNAFEHFDEAIQATIRLREITRSSS